MAVEQLDYNLLFRWFVGLEMDEPIWNHAVFSKNRDRLAGDGSQTISAEMKRVSARGLHRIEVRDRNGELSEAVLELKWKRIHVLPPIGKSNIPT